ncbi:Ribosomal RNA small subunit methyltransferase A [Serratia symbiotica]|nr:Ribosomal RNA small subunit methyltransferase A [Serratia symbiotica]
MNKKIYQGHYVRKRFGQNFLTDSLIINKIISIISPKLNEEIIEIGPGLGALTNQICLYIKHMTVIEIDHDLVIRLKKYSPYKDKLIIYHQDVMTINFFNLFIKKDKMLRIFGSLPYNIAIPLILKLFTYNKIIYDMHFVLQKEIINRLVAQPHNKNYGRLSIIAQYYYKIIPVLKILPTSFTPIPKVDSGLVKFVKYDKMPNFVNNFDILNLVIINAFNQRRKIICNSLSNLFTAKQLTNLGIDISSRAENISISQYCKLANWLSDHSTLLKKKEYYD